ncbi:MAG: DNA methyltransferase [Solirubrobacteraceae bacterium]
MLSSELRKELKKACVRGRKASEKAARAAIGALGVLDDHPPVHLRDEDRNLCRALRAKRDQLGDTPAQIDLLAADCAYEQWHRLLFARFLAENGLLIHPEFKAPVTLAECDDLAVDLGEPDAWAVAGRFAAEILPGIFRLDDPCVRLRLAPEGRLELEQIVEGIPAETFVADDALGWVYQHWQTERKEEVNDSARKIGGADLAPVTQLFTENYMVRFLLENSLGAWWASRHPRSPLLRDWEYLRADDDGNPASGAFEEWPAVVAEVTVMDPCCGSGHFLVEAFDMLWRMRAEEEGLAPAAAQDAVLRENLFGLELDPRCVQIAMFAVAMTAWKAGDGWRELPVPNVACSGVPVKAPIENWQALSREDWRIETALRRLHEQFQLADTLGTLIDPRRATETNELSTIRYDEIAPAVQDAVIAEAADPAAAVFGQATASIVRAAAMLARRFTLVVTNVPYLARAKQGSVLRSFADAVHPLAKHDLAMCMLERLFTMSAADVAVVLPQGWTQLSRYEGFRSDLLDSRTLRSAAFLGSGAFTAISGEVVNVLLLSATISRPGSIASWMAYDVRSVRSPAAKAADLAQVAATAHRQQDTRENPDSRIVPELLGKGPLLAVQANSLYGLRTGDGARLIRKFWEVASVDEQWRKHQSTTTATRNFAGREHILLWEQGTGVLAALADHGIASLQGEGAWGREGIVVSLMGDLPVTRYSGESFDNNCAVVWPTVAEHLAPVWQFLSDPSFAEAVRRIDKSLKVTNQTLLKVPFDADHWAQVADQAGPLPAPSSDDPTQWLFRGRPDEATEPLQVAVARLLGYRWPEQVDADDLDPLADGDAIVCLPSVLGERTAADRLQHVLSSAFGGTWSPARAAELLAISGSRKAGFDAWLRDEFFKAHCQAFQNRPFIWHVWDGRRDGFSALVNYHRLDRPTLERLTYTYLGDWIERQIAGARENVLGAAERLMAARDLKQKLELILVGEPPYDIYVRWKPLAQQAIGWAPDLDDGVRLNVRPFVEAGVLRAKFNVKWEKDRGKNPDGFERHNDVHLTNAEKQAARGA